MDEMEVLGTDTKDVLLATTVVAGVTAMTIEEALADWADFGVFGSTIGAVVGSFFGGPIGSVAGSMIGDFVGSQFTTASIGSSTPIGAASSGGGGSFPSTFGVTAPNFGTSSSALINAFKKHGSVPSKRGRWGNPSTSTNMKVFGSNGIIDTLRFKRRPLMAFLSAYTSSISTSDKRSIGLYIDGFISASNSPTSAGGVATADGCTDQFYTDVRTGAGLASSRQAAVKAGCQYGGFRAISHWSRTLNHRSSQGVANSRQAQNRGQIAIGADAIYRTVSLLGTSTNAVAQQYARFTKVQLIPWPFLARLIWKILDLIIRYGRRRSIIRRLAQDERDEITTTAEISDAMLDTLIEYVHDGIATTGVQRRDAGRKMTVAMSNPGASPYPAALGRNHVDVQANVTTALDNTGDNEDIFVQLVQAYVDWANGDDFNVLSWNSTTHILRRIW